MHECSVHGKRPALTSFVGRAEEDFELREDSTTTQKWHGFCSGSLEKTY